jgi:ABC-type multidrug transport system ATPase subunit
LNVLSGISKPQSGEVLINGHNIYSEEEKIHLKGVIGFVPQDDLLIEELTVYQNLYYSAKMCLDNLSESELTSVINKTLVELDLDETRDLKVGNSLNKVISGGQRKRLNIALELIREPTILFVDEPTSGLSSVDSETVMNLLKEQTYRGKLVIINIHQPGSDIFKMFDKIMIIDKGGYQIYYGNPSEAIIYFKTQAAFANTDEDQCITCGNINSDQLLQIIESRIVNEKGKPTRIRKVTPKEWAEKFSGIAEKIKQNIFRAKQILPENFYSVPGLIKQSGIYFIRDSISKLANGQYILFILLGSPLLAFIMSYFIKYTIGGVYHFSENENLPAYLFMCVFTSHFQGLIISADEIVNDRKILKREAFLNLSWFSYLNSKVMVMFIISAIQSIAFLLIGNFILEIKGMTFAYWLVLFTTSCLANMMGLNISSAFNSVITIYIFIPFIIIPQLLFSGIFVKFDRLHQSQFTSGEFVPVIGDLMPARWSFEALAVEQFKNNKYEKSLFSYKMRTSQNIWYADYLIFEMKKDMQRCQRAETSSSEFKNSLSRLNYYLNYLSGLTEIKIPDNLKPSLNIGNLDSATVQGTSNYMAVLSKNLRGVINNSRNREDSVTKSIVDKIGASGYIDLEKNYHNISLEDLVLDRLKLNKSVVTQDRIIQKYEPGYMKPLSKYGRAQFYAPYKQIGNIKIDTYWFNLLVLWIVTLGLYTALYFKLLQKGVSYFENLQLPGSAR